MEVVTIVVIGIIVSLLYWGAKKEQQANEAKMKLRQAKKQNIELIMHHNNAITLYIQAAKRNRRLIQKYNKLHLGLEHMFKQFNPSDKADWLFEAGIKPAEFKCEYFEDDTSAAVQENATKLRNKVEDDYRITE